MMIDYQICLVNRAMQCLVQPLLFKHIYLSGTEQVKRFNASMIMLRPSTRQLIRGITLLDSVLARVPEEKIDRRLDGGAWGKTGWIKHWGEVISHLSSLCEGGYLSTLVISSEVCYRFQYYDDGLSQPLGKKLAKTRLQVDHLVLSHADLGFFLTRIDCRRLTWYACEVEIEQGRFDVSKRGRKVRSQQLEEITVMASEILDYNKPCTCGHHAESEDDTHAHRYWVKALVSQVEDICKTQEQMPALNIHFHQFIPGVKEQLEKENGGRLGDSIKVGIWGRPRDTSQRMAELHSFASKGWISKQPAPKKKTQMEADQAKDGNRDKGKKKGQGRSVDIWSIRPASEVDWCGCMSVERKMSSGSYQAFDFAIFLAASAALSL
jgi:hypothetical protein